MWISGLINPHGTTARVVAAAATGRVTPVVSQHLLDELATVLARSKFRRWIGLGDAMAFVEALGRDGVLHAEPEEVLHLVRDPNDDYLVALASAAAATIVTGDDDLLAADLKPPAITPRQLVERLGLSS